MKLKTIVFSLILALVSYSAYWYYIADKAEEYVENIVSNLEGEGAFISYDGFKVEGFPYRLIISLNNPIISKTNGDVITAWQSDQLKIYAQPWNFTHLIFTANTSRLTVENRNDFNPDNRSALVVDSASTRLSYNVPRDDTVHISWELNGVNSSEQIDNSPIFAAENIALHIRSAHPDQLSSDNEILAPKLADIALGAIGLSIGEHSSNKIIDELTLVSSLRGDMVPAITKTGLKTWSNSGGTLEVSQLKLSIGTFDVLANGSLTLDENLTPLGALSTRLKALQSVGQIIGRFADLNEEDKATLLSSFTLLELFSGDDGIPLSLTAQGGDLWLGPLRITALSPIL